MNTNNTLSSVSPTVSITSRTQTGAHVVTGRHSSSGGGGDRPSQQQLTQRRKHKAKSSNPLASMKAQQVTIII